jgi:hypothetical protein
MFARTLISRSLRNSIKSKTFSNKNISNFLLFRSKSKMNNSSHLTFEVNEPLLHYSSRNSSSSSLNLRQYATTARSSEETKMKRWSWTWWKEMTIIITVFAITGSTTVRIVRPIVTNVFGIEGNVIHVIFFKFKLNN